MNERIHGCRQQQLRVHNSNATQNSRISPSGFERRMRANKTSERKQEHVAENSIADKAANILRSPRDLQLNRISR